MDSFNIKKILIPVDFSGTGEKVLEEAILLAKKTQAQVTLIHVMEGHSSKNGPDYSFDCAYDTEKYSNEVIEWTKKQMGILKKKLTDGGVIKVNCIIDKGSPHKQILAAAKKIKSDIILMGTHGVSGVREFVTGSNTFRVVSEASCPVLSIQKQTANPGFKNILVPFRDKPHSREEVDYAITIAKLYGATIHVLGISYGTAASEVKKIQLETEQIIRIADAEGVQCTHEVIKSSYVAKVLFNHAQQVNADLIVLMADLDKLAISEYVMGPVIQQIVNHSGIPVLSIHPAYNPNAITTEPVNVEEWSFWN